MDNHNHINPKKPLILRVRELEEELLEVNGTLSSWLLHYCDKVGIPIPDREGLHYLVKKTNEILSEIKQIKAQKNRYNSDRIPRSDAFFHEELPDKDFPEPFQKASHN